MKTKKSDRSKWKKCVVCETPVHPYRAMGGSNTCSPICTEIKNTGKTRDELVREDSLNIQIEKEPEEML